MDNYSKDSFSILTYNILADSYSYKLVDADPTHLPFSYRAPLILDKVKSLSSDIICFQEVDNYHSYYKDKVEELGYEVIYAQKTSLYPDGLIIGLKKERIELLGHEVLEFDSGHEYEDNEDFYRGNIAIVAKLKHIASGKIFNVINTHLFWNPTFDYVKFLQMRQILLHVNKNFNEDDRIIWVGDFNSKPQSNVIRCVLHEKAPDFAHSESKCHENVKTLENIYEKLERIETKVKWASAYEQYETLTGSDTKEELKYTSYTKPYKAIIDHIMYSNKNLKPKKLLKIPNPTEIGTDTLPNQTIPSDHLPLMAVFEFAEN